MSTAVVGRVGSLVIAALITACTMDKQNPQQPASPPPAQSSITCDAAKASFARGEVYSDELAQRAQQSSGAKLVRTLRPGQAVTMEYREDRLNLELDESGRVIDVRCG